MKYYSIIINSSIFDLPAEQLEEIVKNKFKIINTFDKFNKFIIKPEDKNSIGINDFKGLIEWASSKTEFIKSLIIYSAEKLTEEAQNSLLKIIEEPPENILIIFFTNNKDSFLPTILSRCILINFDSPLSIGINEFNEIAQNFLSSNYLERVKLIDTIFNKEEMTREKINKFLNELLRIIVLENPNPAVLVAIKKIYRAIKRGGNIKLSLDYLNLELINHKSNY